MVLKTKRVGAELAEEVLRVALDLCFSLHVHHGFELPISAQTEDEAA